MALISQVYCNQVKQEQRDGKVYDMPQADWRHSLINGNIYYSIKEQLGKGGCKVFMENLGLAYHQNNDDKKKCSDYVVPDIMIICDKSLLKGGNYYGVPKFIVETISPSSAKYDRTEKMEIYREYGVSEYWLVGQNGSLEIYYLKNGKYKLKSNFIYCDDIESTDYNIAQSVTLRDFPNVKMTLGDIFIA